MSLRATPTSLFIAYADTPWRRKVLATAAHLPDEYIFYGLRELHAMGYAIRHNLQQPPAPAHLVWLNRALNRVWHRLGGFGGDWVGVLRNLPQINRSSVVFSTVDRIGIPLVLLKHMGLIRPPLLYTSIGLPERLAQLATLPMKQFYYAAFRKVATIICYGYTEAHQLGAWLDARPGQVQFVPFGVDTAAIHPLPAPAAPPTDVLSVGADPQRDFALLLRLAQRHPDISVRIITSRAWAQHLAASGGVPPHVEVLTDRPLSDVLQHIAAARLVVLPVRPNSYSGATTTLLQAMALAKPVVVSGVAAIAHGYALEDGENCRMVPPESLEALEAATLALLNDQQHARTIGAAARQMVGAYLSWQRYIETLEGHVQAVLASQPHGQQRCQAHRPHASHTEHEGVLDA